MSFNHNHTNPVTLGNYEEWFLLYVDGELNEVERKAVESFVVAYPQLKEELDLLCGTRLTPDPLTLENKSELYSGNMKMNVVDESLLLYIDQELSEADSRKMEARIQADQDLELQYRLLLQTKSDPGEVITCPDKKSLYRTTERRIVPVWMRIAAAVILLAGTGAAFWPSGNEVVDGPSVAVIPPAGQQPQPSENVTTQLPTREEATPSVQQPIEKAVKKNKQQIITHLAAAPAVQPKQSNHLPLPVAQERQQLASVDVVANTKPDQQNINGNTVTTLTADPYHSVAATNNPAEPEHAVMMEPANNEKSGSLKGLLRKATRFIERRTGVAATNENEELLIGAVAIKLK